MKNTLLFFLTFFLFLFITTNASSTALLVQTGDIWTYNHNTYQPYRAMNHLGISYDWITHSDFNSHPLSGYDFIFLQGSDGNTDEFDQYLDMGTVKNFVKSGGLAIIHYADWSGDRTDVGPSGVGVFSGANDFGNIETGYQADPLFENVSDQSIDFWNSTSHGSLTNLPSQAEVLITNGRNQPIYARYSVGNGEVWITTMTLEWGRADHNLMLNELKLADDYSSGQPVPEPGTLILFGSGILGLIGLRKKAFKRV